jgi:ribosomal protein S18 acetylase RimI-like enzyme
MDLVYLGVVPEARGRGLGYELTCKAMFEAKAAGAQELTLCVDARNTPARRIYDQLGFVEFDRRDVFLALFGVLER